MRNTSSDGSCSDYCCHDADHSSDWRFVTNKAARLLDVGGCKHVGHAKSHSLRVDVAAQYSLDSAKAVIELV